MAISFCNKLSFLELKHLISAINEKTDPDIVFFLLYQCRMHVAMGNRWSEIGLYDFELIALSYRCRQNQVIREIERLLAKNQHTPLTLEDADTLEILLDESDHCHLDWNKTPISRNAIWTMIDLARTGYRHLRQGAAA